MNLESDRRGAFIVSLALIALVLKLAIAYNTLGTNDNYVFYGFARVLNTHSLEWTYQHSRYFNHPPLTAYYLRGIYALTEQKWCAEIGLHFPFLLRLPGIIADFLVVLILLRMVRSGLQIPTWALALFAVSPVSVMVSGYHGNTDSVMVLLLFCAAFMCLRGKPVLCGVFLAVGCQIKVVPLLFLPALLFFWLSQKKAGRFLVTFALLTTLLWCEPLLNSPLLFAHRVLSYGSYWGTWGVSYLLRLTGFQAFSTILFYSLSPAQNFVCFVLKAAIVGTAVVIAWRRRQLPARALVDSIAYTWIVFFILAPGASPQYFVWLAPFILILSPKFYAWLLLASSAFLFRFYDVISGGGLPWFIGNSSDELIDSWVLWSLLPWAVLIIGAIAFWRKTAAVKPVLSLVSSETLLGEIA